ncbi:hypothetical protein BT63DRAFT_474160 [Microthyrium microscopicum]|uniref:Alpha/beta-hydrolase n=1 Tax=Microthyrium microscopicum TaxID=703497 RepID=A0A6A6URM8_9PEZI|nr:hypothetical protein BT63DRAFT_474160 [Microthyrium microscopicum]
MRGFLSTLLISTVAAQGSVPTKGDNGEIAGIFGGGMAKGKGLAKISAPSGKAGPNAWASTKSGGSGPYKAGWTKDPTLPNQTVYAPKSPPQALSMPVIAWGESGCENSGTRFAEFLTEIASHGYLIIASGPPSGGSGQTQMKQMTDSIDWAAKGNGAAYGNVDKDKIIAAGQSCGGLEAYSASYHDDRVKLTIIFNSGVKSATTRSLLKQLKAPVGFFLGGAYDQASANGQADYDQFSSDLPVWQAVNKNLTHMATYTSPGGGLSGKSAVPFLEWQMRGDAKAKAQCTDKSAPNSLYKDGWEIKFKNFK